MHLQITNTDKIVTLIPDSNGSIRARVWEGITASGTKVHAFVVRVAIDENEPEDVQSQFNTQLQECVAPSPEVSAIPLRLII